MREVHGLWLRQAGTNAPAAPFGEAQDSPAPVNPLRPHRRDGGPRPRAARPVPDTRWRWSWLLAAPHRLSFFAAAVVMAASSLWWAAVLVARALGHTPALAVPPAPAHALLMSQGFMPLFIAGFLFTAGPRWLRLADDCVRARDLRTPVAAMAGGWLAVIAGFHVHALLAATGMAAVAGGWTSLSARYYALLRRSTAADRSYPLLVGLACGIGAIAMWLGAVALLLDQTTLLRSATQLALWGFVATTFTVVSHRMIPFFTQSALPFLDAWRPMWLLWLLLGALWLSGLAAIAELWWRGLICWHE